MIKRHSVLTGMLLSLTLLTIAIAIYPGGTYEDRTSSGFHWTKNYISNLFQTNALNGEENLSRIWACTGMFFYSLSCSVFFVNMSKKIPEKNAKKIIKYAGISSMPFTLFTITPFHDSMLTISSMLFWTCIVCITVFIIKSKLYFFKFYCIGCLLIFYYAIFLYATNNGLLLPIVQKINIISAIILILSMEYFTKEEDFAHIRLKKDKTNTI